MQNNKLTQREAVHDQRRPQQDLMEVMYSLTPSGGKTSFKHHMNIFPLCP
jgi:hypothetical protein